MRIANNPIVNAVQIRRTRAKSNQHVHIHRTATHTEVRAFVKNSAYINLHNSRKCKLPNRLAKKHMHISHVKKHHQKQWHRKNRRHHKQTLIIIVLVNLALPVLCGILFKFKSRLEANTINPLDDVISRQQVFIINRPQLRSRQINVHLFDAIKL